MKTKLLGGWGEALALEYLRKRGYKPVAMGYRQRCGEIDLIVSDRRYIVFVEVKTRKSRRFAEARESVVKSKQDKLRMTAELWLASNETELQPRFDVIEIYAPESENTKKPEIIHIENAF